MEKDYIREFVDKKVNYDEIAITYQFRVEEYDYLDGELEKKDIEWVYYAKTDEESCVYIVSLWAYRNNIDLSKIYDYEDDLLYEISEYLKPKCVDLALEEASKQYRNGEVYVI